MRQSSAIRGICGPVTVITGGLDMGTLVPWGWSNFPLTPVFDNGVVIEGTRARECS